MYLFDDRPELAFLDPVIVAGIVLALVGLTAGLLIRHRGRRRPPRGPAYQVFRQDAGSALIAWAIGQLAFGAGWALRVEGLRMPIWSYVGVAAGLAIAALLWRRERAPWPTFAKTVGVEQLPDGRVQRGTSQTWEMAFLITGATALLGYLATVDHAYGHPIHWLTTGLLLLPAFALGLAIWSPRFKVAAVRAPRGASATAKRKGGQKRLRRDRTRPA